MKKIHFFVLFPFKLIELHSKKIKGQKSFGLNIKWLVDKAVSGQGGVFVFGGFAYALQSSHLVTHDAFKNPGTLVNPVLSGDNWATYKQLKYKVCWN